LGHLSQALISASTEDVVRQWTAYRCLVFETLLDRRAFVLSAGKWFAVDGDFVADVEARLARIPVVDLGLPSGLVGEQEGDYNQRVARDVPGAALLDRVLFRPRGARSSIEVADLAIGTRLLHVKRKTSSSTLSHLFAQGRIAGETLKQDVTVREALLGCLEAGHPLIKALRPERLQPRSITITFVIVAANATDLPNALPFFSKLNLVRTREFLENALDFDVAAAWVTQPDR
jgi:uncharacterized protein (TIGR04141 family)